MSILSWSSRRDPLGGGSALASAGVALLVAFVTLLLAGVTVAGSWGVRAALAVEPRLTGDITAVVWGRGLESADAAAARAVEVLSLQPGVARVVALEPDVSDRWVGAVIAPAQQGGDGPRLLSIVRSSGEDPAPGLIARARAGGITMALDNHRGTTGPLERNALVTAVIGGSATLLLCGGLVLLSTWRARGVVSRRADRIYLLVRLGARRGFLSSLVGRSLAPPVVGGALLGLVLCEACVLMVLQSGMIGSSVAGGPTLLDAACALPWPLILFLFAGLGATIGASRALGRMARQA